MALVPYSYCNPYIIETNIRTFVIEGEYIKIKQNKENGIGFTLWDCSFVLSDFFQKHFKSSLENKTCVELGTGCGLVSIALSLLKCKQVYATDLEQILVNTKINYEENFKEKKENFTIQKLAWGDIDDLNKFKNVNVDYIICSDCLYEEAPWEKLLDTILYFSKNNNKTQVIFAYKKRYIYQELFLKEIVKYYDIEEIPQEKIYEGFKKETFYIIILKYKN